jgi:hypothetical protein
MLGRALTIAALLACFSQLGFAQLGRAAGSSNAFLAHLVGHLYRHGESFACFSRQYSAAHLAAHPGQQVTFIKALIAAHFAESRVPSQAGYYMYQVSLAFKFRGREETLTGVAECGDGTPKDPLRGGSVCAGPGDKPSHLALDGNKGLVMTFRGGADLWAPGPIEQRHDTVKNPFGPGDVTFRLARTALKQCDDLAFDRQKPFRPHER